MITKKSASRHERRAFSLIELSIVLLIISILVAGASTVSVVALTKKRNEVTKERMEVIYKALGQYLLTNYKLPCPASIILPKTAANYGVADDLGCDATGMYASNLESNVVYGMVPVNSLGLSNEYGEDGFGEKIAYVVNKNFTTAEFPVATNNGGFSFYGDLGVDMINIFQSPSLNITESVVFVLISSGANKFGGFNADSSLQNGASAETYEAANSLSNIAGGSADFGVNAANALSVTFTASDAANSAFDDILYFKTRPDMLVDFNAHFLMGCDSSTANYSAGYSNAFHGTVVYKSSACGSPYGSIYPAKECDALGKRWNDLIQCP